MKIAFLGDVYLSDRLYQGTICGTSPDIFENVRRKVGRDTLLAANIEFAITDRVDPRLVNPYKWVTLCSGPATAERLASIAIAIVANNHAGDAGITGLEDTVEHLRRSGIRSLGYGTTLDQALKPCVLEHDGKKIGLVALCCLSTNGGVMASHANPGIAPLSIQTLRDGISRARTEADAIIVIIHWGCEQTPYPVPDQVRMGRLAIDLGADAVVGCHAHVIQTCEKYKDRWILHGIGNFFFDPITAKHFENRKFLGEVEIEYEAENRESLVPVFELDGRGLRLIDLFATRWDGGRVPDVKGLDEISINLHQINTRLGRWISRNVRKLSDRSEPEFRCRIINGGLAYYYSSAPIYFERGFRKFALRAYGRTRTVITKFHSLIHETS